jgi:hypothetical protein
MATITLNQERLEVASAVPLSEAAVTRPVAGTGFFNYETLRPTRAFFDYADPFMGGISIKPGYDFSLSAI